jgi:asparagine N-glycosylation enzyme membrane subunit Stt3
MLLPDSRWQILTCVITILPAPVILERQVQGGFFMYMDTVVLAGIAVIAGILLFAGCFALFIWLDSGNEDHASPSDKD